MNSGGTCSRGLINQEAASHSAAPAGLLRWAGTRLTAHGSRGELL